MISEAAVHKDLRGFQKRTRWLLNRREDGDYLLLLKGEGVEYNALPRIEWKLDTSCTSMEFSSNGSFPFLDLSTQLQLRVLQHLSTHDVCCCRLVCRSLNKLIVDCYSHLSPLRIGTVDVYLANSPPFTFLPTSEQCHLESKNLNEFHDIAITALQLVEGELCSDFLNSLLSALIRIRATILTLSVINCHLSCTVNEFVTFLKCCNVKTLTINAVDMRPFVHELLQHDVIHNLPCLLLYSVPYVNNASFVLSSMFRDGLSDLKEFRILLKEWQNGFFDILRFHVRERSDWPDRNKIISGLKFRVRGRDREAGNYVLWNSRGRRLRFRAEMGCYFLSPS